MCLDGDTNKIEGVKLSLNRIQEGDEQKSGRLKNVYEDDGKICIFFNLLYF